VRIRHCTHIKSALPPRFSMSQLRRVPNLCSRKKLVRCSSEEIVYPNLICAEIGNIITRLGRELVFCQRHRMLLAEGLELHEATQHHQIVRLGSSGLDQEDCFVDLAFGKPMGYGDVLVDCLGSWGVGDRRESWVCCWVGNQLVSLIGYQLGTWDGDLGSWPVTSVAVVVVVAVGHACLRVGILEDRFAVSEA
jgi:hypothetical protein